MPCPAVVERVLTATPSRAATAMEEGVVRGMESSLHVRVIYRCRMEPHPIM
jgi:hypothetical protein